MFNFSGKTAVITGSARGIGSNIALEFIRYGANVCLCDINEEGLKETALLCEAAGGKVTWIKTDVSKESDINALIDHATSCFGTVDILVNNAGILADKSVVDISLEEFNHMMAVHLDSTFMASKAVIPQMRKRHYGRIINITSLGARQGVYLAGSHYCAAKGGMTGFTRQLAQQLRGDGITINCVAPGTTMTDMTKKRDPKVLEKVAKMFPISRLGLPEEVSVAVLYLASDWARCITGETLDVNGGKYMN